MFQREFTNFLDSHLLWSLGIPLRLEVSIKVWWVEDFFVPLVMRRSVRYWRELDLECLLNEEWLRKTVGTWFLCLNQIEDCKD